MIHIVLYIMQVLLIIGQLIQETILLNTFQ